jgi:hypothetical protein
LPQSASAASEILANPLSVYHSPGILAGSIPLKPKQLVANSNPFEFTRITYTWYPEDLSGLKLGSGNGDKPAISGAGACLTLASANITLPMKALLPELISFNEIIGETKSCKPSGRLLQMLQ